MLNSKTKLSLKCFSPTVMVLTFAIELGLALFVLLKRKPSLAKYLIIAILVLLAIFQLSEYGICQNWVLTDLLWAGLGYASIAILPAMGFHLIQLIAGRVNRLLTLVVYGLAGYWAVLFSIGRVFESFGCHGNYFFADVKSAYGGWFLVYYYSVLLLGIFWAYHLILQSRSKKIRRRLWSLVLGYLTFILPASILVTVYPEHAIGLPSIMCGFALIFALILTFVISKDS